MAPSGCRPYILGSGGTSGGASERNRLLVEKEIGKGKAGHDGDVDTCVFLLSTFPHTLWEIEEVMVQKYGTVNLNQSKVFLDFSWTTGRTSFP